MYDLRTFGDSSSSSASGASRAEMGEVLMRRLKEKLWILENLENPESRLDKLGLCGQCQRVPEFAESNDAISPGAGCTGPEKFGGERCLAIGLFVLVPSKSGGGCHRW